MLVPGRHGNSGDYRYAYQGQEKDPETGMEAFQLRLWDARIGRWLTTDPYGQHFSPYLGMSNNPVSRIDPDGGKDTDPPADIVLDEVVITGNGGGGLQPMGITWTSETGMMDFAGSMSQWQDLTGNVFSTNHSLAYDQWDVSYGDAFRNYNIPTSINSDGFAALYSSGWKAWDKNGLGNDLMNFTAGGIGGAMTLPILNVAGPALGMDGLSGSIGYLGESASTAFTSLDIASSIKITALRQRVILHFSKGYSKSAIGFSAQRSLMKNHRQIVKFLQYQYRRNTHSILNSKSLNTAKTIFDYARKFF